jgi:hypothetical protein
VNSRVFQLVIVATLPMLLAGCSTYTAAARGIGPEEQRVLVAHYYWSADSALPSYTSEQLGALLRASADPTLDGEAAEAQMSKVVVALASVGDDRFSQALAQQPDGVKRAVARHVSDLWRRYGLRYPETQDLLQPYT